MALCVTCGSELHPERARKYDYCLAAECQEKNFKGLTMVAVGMNKAADEFLILDEQAREDLASGKFRDQRRGLFGTSVASSAPPTSPAPPASLVPSASPVPVASSAPAATATRLPRGAASRSGGAQHGRRPSPRRPASPAAPRRPWSKSQEKLALLYNEQGLRPEDIARKLGLSRYTVTQIILTSRNRGKL